MTLPDQLYFSDAINPEAKLFRCTWAINWLATRARTATHFWALNDDVVVNQFGWDAAILTLNPGEIGLTDFTPAAGWHSNFPAFTRAHLDEFATLFHPNFWGWGADHWICRVAALSGRARWLRIDLDHCQADQQRQARIQAHQPPPPPLRVMNEWAERIKGITDNSKKKPAPTRSRQ